ncbi:MAG: hypothetical protein E6J12_09395, partial [Chloroflexi bacterium]
MLVILPGQGRLYDVTGHANLATGLRNPQGLGFDGVENVLVTESDAGRLDRVVRTFALEQPTSVQRLAPDQTVCLGILRAPGYKDQVAIEQAVNADYDPAATILDRVEVRPV